MNPVEIAKELKNLLGDNIEKIILFGSRVRKDFRENSDYDVLVVLKDNITSQAKISLSTYIRKNMALKGIDIDIIIKSQKEFLFYQNKIGSIVKTAVKEGIVL